MVNFYLRHLVVLHKLRISLFMPSTKQIVLHYNTQLPIPGATRSKTWACGRLLSWIVGSNSDWGMEVFLLRVLCCQVEVSAADQSLAQRSPTECFVCVSVIVKPR